MALIITILLHVLVIVSLPESLFMSQSSPENQQEEILEVVIEPPEESRYVEANPDVPENEPDNKRNYSFRSQQAADQNPEDSLSDTPDVESEADIEDDADVRKVVQGSVEQNEPIPLESGVYSLNGNSEASEDSQADAGSPVMPLPSVLPPPPSMTQEPVSEDGSGSSFEFTDTGKEIVENTEPNSQINLYRTDATQQNQKNSAEATDRESQNRPLPRKRLKLPPELTYGQLTRPKSSVSRRGTLAIDATFSQFGEYEQRFYAAVQAVWYQEIEFYQPIDIAARVVVSFRIKSDGSVEDVTVLNSTAGEIATWICETALTKPSPFGVWTEEMIQVFGRERVMEVAFYYR